jgi:hypothetical protein
MKRSRIYLFCSALAVLNCTSVFANPNDRRSVALEASQAAIEASKQFIQENLPVQLRYKADAEEAKRIALENEKTGDIYASLKNFEAAKAAYSESHDSFEKSLGFYREYYKLSLHMDEVRRAIGETPELGADTWIEATSKDYWRVVNFPYSTLGKESDYSFVSRSSNGRYEVVSAMLERIKDYNSVCEMTTQVSQ